MTAMTRNTAIKLLIGAAVAPLIPRPRCDADFVERALANGKHLKNRTFFLERPIRIHSGMKGAVTDCTFVGAGMEFQMRFNIA
jgi:hypothetical protein